MLIGELSTKTGLSKDTIRFYEKQGLIKTVRTSNTFNNYKNYTEEVLSRLMMIKRIKRFGFTLNETATLLDLIDTNKASCKTVSKQITKKVTLIDQKIAELFQLRSLMTSLLTECGQPETEAANCPSLTDLLK